MKSYPTDHVRNILIVGHGGAGKTSLVEAVCHATRATRRVEDGTTVTDFEPEETRKQISVSLAVAPVEPTATDQPARRPRLRRLRGRRALGPARRRGPVRGVGGRGSRDPDRGRLDDGRGAGAAQAFFINKLDRDRASYARCLDGIQAAFGKACAPLYLPIGEEHDFRGLVGLLSGRAFTYENGKRSEGDVPADLADAAASLREQLISSVIQESEDEELMDRYLGGEEIAPTDLIGDLEQAVAAGRLFPVLAGAAIKNIGVAELLEVCTQAFPAPTERPEVEGRRADPDSPLAAYVFKTIADPYVGRMNLFRVISGTFRPDDRVQRHQAQGRAGRPPADRPGQGPGAVRPGGGRRHRRRGQAGRHLHRRHPHGQGRPGGAAGPGDARPAAADRHRPKSAATRRSSPPAWPGPRPRT